MSFPFAARLASKGDGRSLSYPSSKRKLVPSFIALSALRMSQGISVLPSKSVVTSHASTKNSLDLLRRVRFLPLKKKATGPACELCPGTFSTTFAAQMLVLPDKNRS